MHCEMCGKEAEIVYAIIEDVELKVCSDCARHGKPMIKPKPVLLKSKAEEEQPMYDFVENYFDLIRKKERRWGLSRRSLP